MGGRELRRKLLEIFGKQIMFNKDFIELRLEGHKAYDDTRLKLGYKKSSYYGS